MLDNFNIEQTIEAVQLINKRYQTESSGGLFGNMFSLASTSSTPASPPPSSKEQSNSESVFSRMGRMVGIGASEPVETTSSTNAPKAKVASKPAANGKTKSESKSDPKTTGTATTTAARPPQPKHPSDQAAVQPEKTAQPEKPAKDANLMNGAQPPVPTGSFDNRWGQFR